MLSKSTCPQQIDEQLTKPPQTSAEFIGVTDPLWRWSNGMTQDFLDGLLVAMLPSMLMVAWMVWRATPVD